MKRMVSKGRYSATPSKSSIGSVAIDGGLQWRIEEWDYAKEICGRVFVVSFVWRMGIGEGDPPLVPLYIYDSGVGQGRDMVLKRIPLGPASGETHDQIMCFRAR